MSRQTIQENLRLAIRSVGDKKWGLDGKCVFFDQLTIAPRAPGLWFKICDVNFHLKIGAKEFDKFRVRSGGRNEIDDSPNTTPKLKMNLSPGGVSDRN